MKPAGLVAKWWLLGAVYTTFAAVVFLVTGHPWASLYGACGAALGYYLSAVMR